MTINPRDYDLDELRKMASQRGENLDLPEDLEPGERDSEVDVGVGLDGDGTAAGGSFRAGLYRELLPFLDGGVEKPYLAALPETYAAEFLIFEWLEFLTLHAGYRGAADALEYYASTDWITEEVRSDLDEYLRGIEGTGEGESDLDVDDHMLSLVYVAKLRAMA